MSVAPERVTPLGEGRYRLTGENRHRLAYAIAIGADTWVFLDGRVYVVPAASSGRAPRSDSRSDDAALAAPMPATVTAVHVQPDQDVEPGETLILLEAMKMEVAITAPRRGRVARVACQAGDLVQPGVPLIELE